MNELEELMEKGFNLKVNLTELRLLVSTIRAQIFRLENSSRYSGYARKVLIERYTSLLERLENNLNYVHDLFYQKYHGRDEMGVVDDEQK